MKLSRTGSAAEALALLVLACCLAAPGRDAVAQEPSGGRDHSLDVPVSVPGIPHQRGGPHHRGASDDAATLELPRRDRVAILISVGSGMARVLPVEPGASWSGLTRMQLATTELAPYLQYLSEDTEAAFYEIGADAALFCPAAGEQEPGEQVAGGQVAGETGREDTTPEQASVPTDVEQDSQVPAAPSAADCFLPLDPAMRKELMDHLSALAPTAEPASRTAFLAALTDVLTLPNLQRAFLVTDTLGSAAPEEHTDPAEPREALVRRIEELLASRPERDRPRIDILSLAVAGSAVDSELRALARTSGGVYLRRP